MKVAVIGATGFVGSYIVAALEHSGHKVSLLVRPGSEDKVPAGDHFRLTTGDVDSSEALDSVLSDCDAVVYCIGILREIPKKGITFEALQFDGVVRTVEAARRCDVGRFLLMSANGVERTGTDYQSTKFRAEQHVLASGLDATIFRPSVIFGNPHGRMEIATQLCRDMVRVPYPAVGFFTGLSPKDGAVKMSPVHVSDVARAFLAALRDPSTIGQTFVLGGPEILSWTAMIRRIAATVGRRKWILPYPIFLMKAIAGLLDWLPAFPVTRDQLTMLAEGNTAHCAELESLIGRTATRFEPEHLEYLRVASSSSD
ncbi:MAG: NAD(P)H-binding protein [Gammaproteobacteria bacterium]|nr:NAD(P)H-binding protein [Gammaproteobacteria bacterium]